MSSRSRIETISSPVSPIRCQPSWMNCSGKTPMPTRFERWMRPKLSAITARTPRSLVPLALVAHRRVVDRHHLAGRVVLGDAALDVGGDLVADADVGEGAAHHHLV